MSDDLDDRLRVEAWRRMCPGITDLEVAVLDALPESRGLNTHPARMLAAYRAGVAAGYRAGVAAGVRTTDLPAAAGDRGGHHRHCTWLGPREGWRCIRGCDVLLAGLRDLPA